MKFMFTIDIESGIVWNRVKKVNIMWFRLNYGNMPMQNEYYYIELR